MDLQEIGSIARALGKPQKTQNGYLCRCPAHDDIEPSLSLTIGNNGDLVVNCFANCDFKAIFDALRLRELLPGEKKLIPRTEVASEAASSTPNPEKEKLIKSLWDQAKPAHGTPVEVYLKSRCITVSIPESIRYTPSLFHSPTKTKYPSMIAAIKRWPDGEVIGIHRTYLEDGGKGKAQIRFNRMMLGDVGGAAVRLGELQDEIFICEGVETGLSIQEMTGGCVWAALSAGNLSKLILPDVKIVRIMADHDEVGLDAAQTAAQQYHRMGKKVYVDAPKTRGHDYNDVLKDIHKNLGGI